MSVKFQVNFDTPQEIYYSGQTLSGEVHLVLLKAMQLKCINVIISGNGRVSWSTYQDDNCISLVDHSGNEAYVDCRTCSYSAINGGQFELSAGQHFYRFKYVLPSWLPSSFEGTHGFIRYAVEVSLERPLKFDCSYKKPFTVCRSLNLTREDSLGLPAQVELRRKFDLGHGKSGFLIVQLNVLSTGYVIRESTILVRVDVANSSGFSLNSLHLQLRKIVKYMCDHPVAEEKEEAKVIATDRRDCLVENDQRQFIMCLKIPMTPPTTISYCKLIHIWYELKLDVVLPGCGVHGNPCVIMPIILGTTGTTLGL